MASADKLRCITRLIEAVVRIRYITYPLIETILQQARSPRVSHVAPTQIACHRFTLGVATSSGKGSPFLTSIASTDLPARAPLSIPASHIPYAISASTISVTRHLQAMPTYIVNSSAQPVVQRGRSRHRAFSISVPNIFKKRSSHREPSVLRRGRSPSRARSQSRVRFITEDRDRYGGRRHDHHHRTERTVYYVADRSRSRVPRDDRHHSSGHVHVRRWHSVQALPRQEAAYYYSAPGVVPHGPISPHAVYHPPVQHVPQAAPMVYASQGFPYVPGPLPFPNLPPTMSMPPAQAGFPPVTYAMPVAPPTSPYAQNFAVGAPPGVYAGQPHMAAVQYVGNGVPGTAFHRLLHWLAVRWSLRRTMSATGSGSLMYFLYAIFPGSSHVVDCFYKITCKI